MTDQRSSAVTAGIRLELGEVTDGDGAPLDYEAIIFFAGMYDSPEIRVNAPGAQAIARRIVELWNGAPAQLQPQWQPIETAPKDGSFIWLSDGFFMRVGYWYVITSDPSQEHWADMLRAERGGLGDFQWEPVYWQPLPLPPGRPSVPSTDGSTPEASHG